MKDQNAWHELMASVEPVCDLLTKELRSRIADDVTARITLALLQNGLDSYRAIKILYAASFSTQAQVLIRVLVEVRIDLQMFLRLTAENPQKAARRVIDAMMLEKIRQQRETDFGGHQLVDGAPSPVTLLSLEKKLVTKYGASAGRAMRRHGFSGLSVRDRAITLGLSDLYNVVYRNFSRNVHGTDYMEHFRAQGIATESSVPEFEDSRDHVALSTAVTCLWKMATMVNDEIEHGLGEELHKFWQMCTSFDHWVPVPTGEGGNRAEV